LPVSNPEKKKKKKWTFSSTGSLSFSFVSFFFIETTPHRPSLAPLFRSPATDEMTKNTGASALISVLYFLGTLCLSIYCGISTSNTGLKDPGRFIASLFIYLGAHAIGRGIPKYYLDVAYPSPHSELRRAFWRACLDLGTLVLNGVVCGSEGIIVNVGLTLASINIEGSYVPSITLASMIKESYAS
jgi:hypothetical protein